MVGLLPMGGMYYVSILAETNRVPFDLPEGESELVSGYNVEYGGMAFGLIFIAEYGHMVVMSALGAIVFMGGVGSLGVKVSGVLLGMIWVRGSLPRMRYDQLMGLIWKVYLIGTLAGVTLIAGVLMGMDGTSGVVMV